LQAHSPHLAGKAGQHPAWRRSRQRASCWWCPPMPAGTAPSCRSAGHESDFMSCPAVTDLPGTLHSSRAYSGGAACLPPVL